MTTLFYIGPGMGIGTIIIILVIGLLVLFSFAYILWIPIKRFFKNIFGGNKQK